VNEPFIVPRRQFEGCREWTWRVIECQRAEGFFDDSTKYEPGRLIPSADLRVPALDLVGCERVEEINANVF